MSAMVPVIVTTSHRGVFFGYGIPSDAPTIRIERARMVVYWSADTKGVLGLAANGPSAACKIGPQVRAITLLGVTSVIEVSEEAALRMEDAPWSL